MTTKGNVTHVLPTTTYGKENKEKGGFVVLPDGAKKPIAFTAFGKTLDIVKSLKAGDTVEVEFVVESREWNEKWYSDVVALGVKVISTAKPAGKTTVNEPIGGFSDDLPF